MGGPPFCQKGFLSEGAFVRRCVCQKVRLSEGAFVRKGEILFGGALLRRAVCQKVFLSEGSFVRRGVYQKGRLSEGDVGPKKFARFRTVVIKTYCLIKENTWCFPGPDHAGGGPGSCILEDATRSNFLVNVK